MALVARSRRKETRISQIREMESTLGPDVGRSMRLGTELVIRHREVGRNFGVQRGPDSIIDQDVSDLCSEIKLRNRRSTAALEPKTLASYRLT